MPTFTHFTNVCKCVSYTHSPIHTHTHTPSNLGFQYLSQGHFAMQTGGTGDRTTDCLIADLLNYAP